MSRSLLPALLVAFAACNSPAPRPEPITPPARDAASLVGDEIVVCGERVHIGAPVVLWTDVDGYDATATDYAREKPPENMDPATGRRYTPGRVTREGEVLVPPDSTDLARLAEVVDLFVVHYDVAGTSRTCFRVLQEMRGLSVHFLLDVDGTIYQTLDLRERAWHASQANTRSIGVEIAQMGARSPGAVRQLEAWYREEPGRTRLTIPPNYGDGGVRTPGFQGEAERPGLLRGQIHGADYMQYDFTPEQYESLIKLIAGVSRVLPRIAADAPRGADGQLLTRVLTDEEYENFSGVIGHYHLTTNKIDPGPAFDWERVLYGVRRELRRSAN
ncbi:MAG: N-acetylmuramoyl-L-alanine amidase [Planctomycetes bacterium]|nr:N-acetylmuramoyl-L-alanine amidase [Planctomycetota bacterium]MCB9905617.1 N-acetylmuramoyl-L-alanine amidase [Planctomycetota bacterium]